MRGLGRRGLARRMPSRRGGRGCGRGCRGRRLVLARGGRPDGNGLAGWRIDEGEHRAHLFERESFVASSRGQVLEFRKMRHDCDAVTQPATQHRATIISSSHLNWHSVTDWPIRDPRIASAPKRLRKHPAPPRAPSSSPRPFPAVLPPGQHTPSHDNHRPPRSIRRPRNIPRRHTRGDKTRIPASPAHRMSLTSVRPSPMIPPGADPFRWCMAAVSSG